MRAHGAGDLPEGIEGGLEAQICYNPSNLTYPFGAYICVVDVDPGTGQVKVRSFVAVDDCGTRINPMIIEGQIHGGLTDGVGMALMEIIAFDEDGNCLSGSLMDYLIPTALECPDWQTGHTVTPSPHHPIGAKGVGRVGDRRIAARDRQRHRRRPQAVRRAPRRHAAHPVTGVGRHAGPARRRRSDAHRRSRPAASRRPGRGPRLAARVPFVHATVVRAQCPTSSHPGDAALVLADGTIEGFVGGQCAEGSVRDRGARRCSTAARRSCCASCPRARRRSPTSPGAPDGGQPVPVGRRARDLPRAALPAPLLARRRHAPPSPTRWRRSPSRSASPPSRDGDGPAPPAGAPTAVVDLQPRARRGVESIRAALDAGVGLRRARRQPHAGRRRARRRSALDRRRAGPGAHAGRAWRSAPAPPGRSPCRSWRRSCGPSGVEGLVRRRSRAPAPTAVAGGRPGVRHDGRRRPRHAPRSPSAARTHWFCGTGCRDRYAVGRGRRDASPAWCWRPGSSSRLGRPKQLLAYRGRDPARRHPRAWPGALPVRPAPGHPRRGRPTRSASQVDLGGFEVVENADARPTGCSSSIVAALGARRPGGRRVGAAPRRPAGRAVADGGGAARRAGAGRAARPSSATTTAVGHPFWFGRDVFDDLAALHGDKARVEAARVGPPPGASRCGVAGAGARSTSTPGRTTRRLARRRTAVP